MIDAPAPAGVVDIGGSGGAVWHLTETGPVSVHAVEGRIDASLLRSLAGEAARNGRGVLLATPGQLVAPGRVTASNLGWQDLDLSAAAGAGDRDVRWVNDAAAIAAGERALHGLEGRVLVLVFGTGLGVALATEEGAGTLMWSAEVECAHMPTGGTEPCACGRVGCLEVVVRRWLATGDGADVARAGFDSLVAHARPDAIVLCGGVMRDGAAAAAVTGMLDHRAGVPVLGSAAAPGHKSAAPHGAELLWPTAARVR